MAQQRDEKNEKEPRKHDEKSTDEKQWEEKARRDPLSALTWPAILIWAGIVLLVANLGLLNLSIGRFNGIGENNTWSVIFVGAGVILLLEVLARQLAPSYRRPILGTVILAVILIGIGLGNLTNWNIVWPILIILIGASILLRGFIPRR